MHDNFQRQITNLIRGQVYGEYVSNGLSGVEHLCNRLDTGLGMPIDLMARFATTNIKPMTEKEFSEKIIGREIRYEPHSNLQGWFKKARQKFRKQLRRFDRSIRRAGSRATKFVKKAAPYAAAGAAVYFGQPQLAATILTTNEQYKTGKKAEREYRREEARFAEEERKYEEQWLAQQRQANTIPMQTGMANYVPRETVVRAATENLAHQMAQQGLIIDSPQASAMVKEEVEQVVPGDKRPLLMALAAGAGLLFMMKGG